jgi:hypothetical protein
LLVPILSLLQKGFKPSGEVLRTILPSVTTLVATPSTPLPSPTTGGQSPAWNPRSTGATADSASAQMGVLTIPALHWLKRIEHHLDKRQIKLQANVDPYRGRECFFVEFSNVDCVKVRFGVADYVQLPLSVLAPIRPTKMGDRVIVLQDGINFGISFIVHSLLGDICSLGPLKSRSKFQITQRIKVDELVVYK